MSEFPRELRTALDFIRWGASRFNREGLVFGHGTDNALDEAAWLVTHALALPPDLSDRYLDCRLTKAEKRCIGRLFDRRLTERCPAAYLTHEAWFAGLKFYVDQRVLVPRSPIAELIENFFEPWIERDRVRGVLDLCTGSGCIGIACAYAFPHAEVDLADVSPDALVVAEENIRRHDLGKRVRAMRSDLLADVKGRYDIIVSNPPYVHDAEVNGLPAEYAHEPKLGLAAADQGLEFALRILCEAHAHLNEGGVLVVEVGEGQQALMERLPQVPFVWLEFQRGADGVFLLTRDALGEALPLIDAG